MSRIVGYDGREVLATLRGDELPAVPQFGGVIDRDEAGAEGRAGQARGGELGFSPR